jgi:hypothetical protein
MRRDDEDDNDVEDADDDSTYVSDRSPPKFPGIVMAAGVIWIAEGILALVNAILSIIAVATKLLGAGAPDLFDIFLMCLLILMSFAFLYGGYRTVKGKATASLVLMYSIVSLLLGFIQTVCGALTSLGGGFLVALLAAGKNAGDDNNADGVNKAKMLANLILIVAVMYLLFGLSLILGGIFGLTGHGSFVKWKNAHSPRYRRRTKPVRRDEENEDEDENERST